MKGRLGSLDNVERHGLGYVSGPGHYIRGGGGGAGYNIWENRGSESFCDPSQDRVKIVAPPPLLKSRNFVCPPPYIVKTSSFCRKKQPQNVFWSKLFPPPPLFVGVKLHSPPSCFVVPPPLPVISDKSLTQPVCTSNSMGPWVVFDIKQRERFQEIKGILGGKCQ